MKNSTLKVRKDDVREIKISLSYRQLCMLETALSNSVEDYDKILKVCNSYGHEDLAILYNEKITYLKEMIILFDDLYWCKNEE